MKAVQGWYLNALGALLILAGIVVGAALGRDLRGVIVGGVIGAGAWWALVAARRRGGDTHEPPPGLPERWRAALEDWVDHYHRLPPERRPRFEESCRRFLADKRVSGVGIEVDDELRLLVAASAATLSLGWPGYRWDQLTEVLLYPDDFDRDDYGSEDAELAGEAHAWGTVILSVPTLEHSFEDPDDGYHVGFHEFAHLLDLEQGDFGGLPSGLGENLARRWQKAAEGEMARLVGGGRSAFDPYGAHDPAEFFAVAVEAFFERPLSVRRRHGEVYELLREYFAQDPARWEQERRAGAP